MFTVLYVIAHRGPSGGEGGGTDVYTRAYLVHYMAPGFMFTAIITYDMNEQK